MCVGGYNALFVHVLLRSSELRAGLGVEGTRRVYALGVVMALPKQETSEYGTTVSIALISSASTGPV